MFCKALWESSVLVKLLYSYISTKDKLFLNYFMRKHFQLLMATFGISKELIVTLKYHYRKKNISLVETLKYLCFLKFHKEN